MKREQLESYKCIGRSVRTYEYLRKSREEEGMSRAETLDKHRAALAAYAEKYGFEIIGVFEEVVSGESLFARPKMLDLLKAISNGECEAVLCMDMQRLGRGGMYDQGFILDTFQSSETLIVTPERIYDLTKDMDMQAAEMETFLSRGEYRMITKRLRRGLLQIVDNGAYTSNAPFGYRRAYQGKLPTLEIVPEEAEYVRQIFQMYADGNGCTRIAGALTAMGVRGRRNSSFNRNTVRLILDNPVYIGKVRWNKTSLVRSGVGSDRMKKTVYNSKDHWKIIGGRHPAIISEELWDTVQARRESNYFYVDNHHVASPLAGLVHCSKCGRPMVLQGKNKGVPYLLCQTKGCTAGAKFDFVEQSVLHQLEQCSQDLRIAIQQQTPPDVSGLQFSLEKTQEHLKRLDDRRSRMYSLLEDGVYTPSVFSERMQVLAEEETRLNDAVSSLKNEIVRETSWNKEKQLAQLDTVLKNYKSSTIPGKKQLLQSIVSVIYYTKEKKTKPSDFSLSLVLRDFF